MRGRLSFEIPRQFRGENRILMIFKGKKSFGYSLVGFVITMTLFSIGTNLKHPFIGLLLGMPFVLIAYFLGTYRIPKESKDAANEDIDIYLFRIYKRKKNKVLYTSLKEE